MRLSYVTANLIGQPSGWSGEDDWGALDEKMVAQTTPESFRQVCRSVRAMGFEGIEVYTGHCSYISHGLDHAEAIRRVCEDEGLTVVGYAGGFGFPEGTRDDWQRTFSMCRALGAPLMTGGIAGEWDSAADMLREEGLVIAYENHPEKTADEILEKIGSRGDVIKVGLDTGNITSQGGDALEAAVRLYDRIAHVHLKDVREVSGHSTLALGRGVAKVREVVMHLIERDYDGWASIEHEPFERSPDTEVAESLETVRKWSVCG